MAKVSPHLARKLALLPDKPGVYLWIDEAGVIIYVGKALVLKHRVRSYVTGTPSDSKTARLVKRIADLDYIVTETESEAFTLEANLIKRHRPQYNILLKDDKKYPFIQVSLSEPFPRVTVTRDLVKDGSRYFGPYTDVKALRRTLRHMEWIFPLRTCRRVIPDGEPIYEKACINHQLGLCPAPCIGLVNKNDYRRTVSQLIHFLQGKHGQIIEEMRVEMEHLSEEMRYEEAAKVRDRINELERLKRNQTMYFSDLKDRDIIALYREESIAAIVVLKMIEGKIINKELYPLVQVEEASEEELMNTFLTQYYAGRDDLPHDILLQVEPTEMDVLQNWLHNRLHVPQRGDKNQLIGIARQNAFHYVEETKLSHLRRASRTIVPVQELKDKLQLRKLPRKMVCMDISTIQGTDTVSSAVYFENGKPSKKRYRHFIMQTVEGQNDFASMAETLTRFLRNCQEDPDLKPDLIIIDGGKGQLSAAHAILANSQATDIEMISLAKRIEEVFLPNQSESIILPRNSVALRLLTAIRDEAHRFAITFHRKRRSNRTLTSALDQIKGVGDKTKFLLLKEFGSVEAIKNAKVQEIAKVKGVGPKLAETIVTALQNNEETTAPESS